MSGSSRFTIVIATVYYRCKPSRSSDPNPDPAVIYIYIYMNFINPPL